tara:strand:+ start:290 stop:625 length:336 start_codon:yes stop_codon:yes gene_type:complete
MSQKLMDVDSGTFKKEVLDSDVPVVVDFWAEWCMPCRMISPIVDELSDEYNGKVKFAKLNIDNNTDLASELQILSIPALVLFRNGKELARITGANPKENIKDRIDSALGEK